VSDCTLFKFLSVLIVKYLKLDKIDIGVLLV